jgi:protocatechuate 3,4-dioxygenase beta subunit
MSNPSTSHDDHDDHDDHDEFGGFHRDLSGLVGRRRLLVLAGGAGLAGLLAACGGDATSSTTGSTTGSTTSTTSSTTRATAGSSTAIAASAGAEIPDETAGPYPADGSNGPNLLTEQGIVRSDITASVGSLSGTAEGIPITMSLTVVDNETGEAMPGAAVYLWHCTADGRYSIYEVTDQNYLRGVQTADADGVVTFTSVFPGCYAGRWPHCHFEVYESADVATAGSAAITTSQLALPQESCAAAYTDSRYGNSARNLSQLSLATDGIFRDGYDDQLAEVSGSTDSGFQASLLIRV